MIQPGTGSKRKRDERGLQSGCVKRRATRPCESTSPDIEQLERRITEDPSKNHQDVETLLQMLDLAKPSAKKNLKAGVALCKVFSRLVASGNLAKDDQGRKQSQQLSAWFHQKYATYRKTLAKLLRSVPASQRLPIAHLCWRVLEQDAELMDNSVWVTDSMFKPLLSAVIETPDNTDIRNIYVGEYMNHCHDCCYHSLAYFSYVYPSFKFRSHSLMSGYQGLTSLQAKMRR